MTDKQILLLKGMVLGYSSIVIKESKDHKDKEWYQHSYKINKYFSKKKQKKVSEADKKQFDKIYAKLVEFDIEYFKDKDYSAYACMFSILEYLVFEVRDLECRNRFSHLPYQQIRLELETMKGIKEVAMDTNKYLTEVLKIVENVK